MGWRRPAARAHHAWITIKQSISRHTRSGVLETVLMHVVHAATACFRQLLWVGVCDCNCTALDAAPEVTHLLGPLLEPRAVLGAEYVVTGGPVLCGMEAKGLQLGHTCRGCWLPRCSSQHLAHVALPYRYCTSLRHSSQQDTAACRVSIQAVRGAAAGHPPAAAPYSVPVRPRAVSHYTMAGTATSPSHMDAGDRTPERIAQHDPPACRCGG